MPESTKLKMDNKPLPALPSPALTTLSVEARNHRALLIRHFLSDIPEPRIESRRDGWSYALEQALDDLSEHFNRGDWLSSIRRGRESKQRSLSVTQGDPIQGQHDKPLPESPDELLKKLWLLITSKPASAKPRGGHLVICVSPHQSRGEHTGFAAVADIGCSFSGGTFSVQHAGSNSTILYGLDGLRGNLFIVMLICHLIYPMEEFTVDESNLRLVGGTFTFKGVDSPAQHVLLTKVLRLAIYVHLSLLLEQYLLSDSRVHISFPPPVLPHSPSTPVKLDLVEAKPVKHRSRNTIFPSSFINVFRRRTLSGRPRTNDIGGSISETPVEITPRKSFDSHLHRFSLIGEKRSSIRRPAPQPDTRKRFEATLHRVSESLSLLSTSPGVSFKMPKILVDLADKERMTQSRVVLRPDERIALSSLLGWDGKDAEGKGMSGMLGFVRYQELSVLYSRHIPPLSSERSSGFSTISSSTSSIPPTTGLSHCGKAYWMTYCYYSSGDRILGDMINDLAKNTNLPCERPGCLFTRGQHESRIIHGRTKIVIQTNSDDENSADDLIQMWQSCAICDARTPRTNMHDGTLCVRLLPQQLCSLTLLVS